MLVCLQNHLKTLSRWMLETSKSSKTFREQHGQQQNWLGNLNCIHYGTESLYQLLCLILSSLAYIWQQIHELAACGALTLCVRPIFSHSFFVSFVIIVYSSIELFSVVGVKVVACSKIPKSRLLQQTHNVWLIIRPMRNKNNWNGTTISTSPSSLKHASVIIGQPMWISRGTGCNLNQSYFTLENKDNVNSLSLYLLLRQNKKCYRDFLSMSRSLII